MEQLGYDQRLAAHMAGLDSHQLHAVTVLGHAWRCLEGRMDLRRFCGYLELMPRIGSDIEGHDSRLLAHRSVEMALCYTAWERSQQPGAPPIPADVLRGTSDESAEEAISRAQVIVGAEAIAALRNVEGSERADFGLAPLGPEPPPLDFDPSTDTQGDYGDPYLRPALAEALALENYFAAAGVVLGDDDATWRRVVEDHGLGRPFDGEVKAVVSNGLKVSIYDPAVPAFLPFSQLVRRPADIRRIKAPERWVAKRDRFKVLRYDRSVGYIVIAPWDEYAQWRPFTAALP